MSGAAPAPVFPLTPQDDGGTTVADAAGAAVYLPRRRVPCSVRLGGQPAVRQAVVDTGAPACILSKSVWSELHARGQVAWACHPPGLAPAAALPATTLLGRKAPYRLGRVALQFVDIDCPAQSLPSRPVLTLCLEDDTAPVPHQVIVGLTDVLDGRALSLHVSEDGQRWLAAIAEP